MEGATMTEVRRVTDVVPMNDGSNPEEIEKMVFWTGNGNIVPSLLYRFFETNGFGLYYPKGSDIKNANPVVVKVTGNLVNDVSETFLLQTAKDYVLEITEEEGKCDPIIDSLHSSTGLFGNKNQKLLGIVNLTFIEDTKETAKLFFRNTVVEITASGISQRLYNDFDGHVWEKNIIQHDFTPVDFNDLSRDCDFLHFIKDITVVADETESENRFLSMFSIIGYLAHRYKDPTRTKAIILMDASPSGSPNGRSGKTLVCQAVGKLRNMSTIDGKSYDHRRWFRFSSVNLSTDLLLFDDIQKNFDFEQLFPLMTTGMQIQRKYKDDVFIPYEQSPKVVITTNYAVIGEGSSFKARTFEFEVSNTFSADYQPTDKYGRRFFDEWEDSDWNYFYNMVAFAIKHYLRQGLVISQPINLRLSKLIHQTNEDFVDFCRINIEPDIRYDKRELYMKFKHEFPEYGSLTQRVFTEWLKRWGVFIGASVEEGHSGDTRHITFVS
jgi:hypothetical protein